MTTISDSAAALVDPFSRIVDELETSLEIGDGASLAAHFVAAEQADFYWEARRDERALGPYQSLDEEEDRDLERVAVSGFFAGRWFVATSLVDSDGAVHDLLDLMRFEHRIEAQSAFVNVH